MNNYNFKNVKGEIYMTIWIVSILTAVCFCIGFTGLLPKMLKPGYYIALGVFFLAAPNLLGPVLGQSITVLYVLVSLAVVFTGSHRDLTSLLCSAFGYFIVIFVNHMYTIPLSLMGITIDRISRDHPIAFLLLQTFTTALLILLIRRCLLRRIIRYLPDFPATVLLLLLAEMLIGISLLAAGFAFGEITGYPPQLLAYNGILTTLLILLAAALFYFMFRLMRNNYELSLKQQEYALRSDYFQRMEGFYDEVRSFRHDYKNILTTMRDYIDSGNLTELKEYFNNKILPGEENLSNDYFILGALKSMKVLEVKSILYTKLLHAVSSGCHVKLDIADEITDANTDPLELSRILGILLDNCIEAALQTQEKQLSVAILRHGKSIIFHFENSTLDLPDPEKLEQPGYSTKPGHQGIGLATLHKKLNTLPNLSYISNSKNGVFLQELGIGNEVE